MLTQEKTNTTANNNPPSPTANKLVVYLDTSKSMAGYIADDKSTQTIFSHTLQELRNFVSIVNPPLDVAVRRVDAQVGEPNPDGLLSQASLDKKIYNGNETNLAGAINLFNPVAGAGSDAMRASASQKSYGKGAGDETAPPARFHVLVTDGVQSQKKAGVADGECLAGSDQVCVRKRILALLNQGWGGYVIGLRSEFNGKVYSEVAGGAVDYASSSGDTETYRPFYIYLFSPDRIALDKMVVTLSERLRPILPSPDAMRTLALSSDYSKGNATAQLVVPAESEDALSIELPENENPKGFILRVDQDEATGTPAPFEIETAINWSATVQSGGSPKELAELIEWQVTPDAWSCEAEGDGKQVIHPEIKLQGKPEITPDGKIKIKATASFPSNQIGDTHWRVYRLEGRLNLAQHTPGWIRAWSTNLDTTREAANKTLYLESALLGLWRNPELEKQTIARIYIMAGA